MGFFTPILDAQRRSNIYNANKSLIETLTFYQKKKKKESSY